LLLIASAKFLLRETITQGLLFPPGKFIAVLIQANTELYAFFNINVSLAIGTFAHTDLCHPLNLLFNLILP
jgi:hypothetical protein